MNTYDHRLSKYYDLIYSSKAYKKEADFILKHCPNRNSLIDIGCGTCNHSLILSEHFNTILGLDESLPMLMRAKQKTDHLPNVALTNEKIETVKGRFSCAISMFNVINHIHTIEQLSLFFETANTALIADGVFIFDCWNGVSCIIDPPKLHEKREIHIDNMHIICDYYSNTDIFNSTCEMKNEISIKKGDTVVENIQYELKHTLWTPKIITNLLLDNGFESPDIYAYFTKEKAVASTSRITFVVKKK